MTRYLYVLYGREQLFARLTCLTREMFSARSEPTALLLRLKSEGKTLLTMNDLNAATILDLHADARHLAVRLPVLVVGFRILVVAEFLLVRNDEVPLLVS